MNERFAAVSPITGSGKRGCSSKPRQSYPATTLSHVQACSVLFSALINLTHVSALRGQLFFYMAFACCVNIYMVSVNTSST